MWVGYFQFLPEFGKPQFNLEKFLRFMEKIEADLVVLPELTFTGYLFESREEALSFSETPGKGEIFNSLLELSFKRSIIIVYGFPEREGEKLYNSAVCIFPNGNFYIYRKIHLFGREREIFNRGEEIPEIIEWEGTRMGIMICYDWAFPEMARILSLKGAQILLHPSNLILPYGQQAMRIRSLENRVFSITSNRVGAEKRGGKELTFTGGSQIVSPRGEILAKASENGEEMGIVEIHPHDAEDKCLGEETNLLNDRRPELYGDICS